ncbi:MAG: NAD(P)/FAD-dependent oxidoreductase [Rhodospirillales bacterium]|nr:NAD(P)/FAD-dependent oxidoreductase [Rhodospirillales bacterium]
MSARESDSITIAGAGPAGLVSAIVLARAGRTVVVREWHESIGHRFHDDFQGLENWSDERDVLEEMWSFGVAADFDSYPVKEGTVFDPKGRARKVRSSRPLYYTVRRGSLPGTLDEGLLSQARRAGAEIRFGDKVQHLEGKGILAGGPRIAGAIAVGYVFETDMADGDWFALGNDLAPLGYAYLLVHGGRGTLATCLFTEFKHQAEYLKRTARFFVEKAGLTMRVARPFGGFINVRVPRHAVQGGHPVIGEQAGFQDALAGFGLRYAMRSGALAARSVIEGVSYERLWRQALRPGLSAGVVNRMLFNALGERGWQSAVNRLAAGDTGLVLRRFYGPSILSRVLFPMARRFYRRPLADPSCDHRDCQCVWCACQAEQA